jgi:hypothetical protein
MAVCGQLSTSIPTDHSIPIEVTPHVENKTNVPVFANSQRETTSTITREYTNCTNQVPCNSLTPDVSPCLLVSTPTEQATPNTELPATSPVHLGDMVTPNCPPPELTSNVGDQLFQEDTLMKETDPKVHSHINTGEMESISTPHQQHQFPFNAPPDRPSSNYTATLPTGIVEHTPPSTPPAPPHPPNQDGSQMKTSPTLNDRESILETDHIMEMPTGSSELSILSSGKGRSFESGAFLLCCALQVWEGIASWQPYLWHKMNPRSTGNAIAL